MERTNFTTISILAHNSLLEQAQQNELVYLTYQSELSLSLSRSRCSSRSRGRDLMGHNRGVGIKVESLRVIMIFERFIRANEAKSVSQRACR